MARRAWGRVGNWWCTPGFTAAEIVDETLDWDAELLVLGTHARGWGARMMLGRVAEAASRGAQRARDPARAAGSPSRPEDQLSEALRVAAMAGIAV